MDSDKRVKKLLNGLLRFYERYNYSDVVITDEEIDFKSKFAEESNLIGHIIFFLLIIIPPVLLIIYEESDWSGILALIWVAIFSYQSYKAIRYTNQVTVQISHRSITIKNIDIVGKYLFKAKKLDFNQIKEFRTEVYKVTRYGPRNMGLVIVTKDEEKQRLMPFDNEFVAEKTKNILNMIIQLKNKITESNKSYRQA